METVVKGNRRRVRQGGLMRCCLQTIAQYDEDTEVGDRLTCKYENREEPNMVVAEDGMWEWVGNRDPVPA